MNCPDCYLPMQRSHSLMIYTCRCGRKVTYLDIYKNSCSLMAAREFNYGGSVAVAQTSRGTWVPTSVGDADDVCYHYLRVQRALGIKPHGVGVVYFDGDGDFTGWSEKQ